VKRTRYENSRETGWLGSEFEPLEPDENAVARAESVVQELLNIPPVKGMPPVKDDGFSLETDRTCQFQTQTSHDREPWRAVADFCADTDLSSTSQSDDIGFGHCLGK
jgi:hypothetical protein